MNKLALCSKVLYDKTIIEFKIENEHLRKENIKLGGKVPKIIFNNFTDWYEVKRKMHDNIQESIQSLFKNIQDPLEKENIVQYGFTNNIINNIETIIRTELYNLTMDVEWSNIQASEIKKSLIIMIGTLVNSQTWSEVYKKSQHNILFKHIIFCLGLCFYSQGDKLNAKGILDNIPHYQCKTCFKLFPLENTCTNTCIHHTKRPSRIEV